MNIVLQKICAKSNGSNIRDVLPFFKREVTFDVDFGQTEEG